MVASRRFPGNDAGIIRLARFASNRIRLLKASAEDASFDNLDAKADEAAARFPLIQSLGSRLQAICKMFEAPIFCRSVQLRMISIEAKWENSLIEQPEGEAQHDADQQRRRQTDVLISS
jgi:hypothetical protein